MGKTTVIAVANNKGGVAKTTTAGNLGSGIARSLIVDGDVTGYVLMIDLDPQGNLSDFYGVRKRAGLRCIGNVLDKAGDTAVLKENIVLLDRSDDGFPRPNMFLIPASRDLEYVTEDLVLRQFSKRHGNFELNNVLQDALAPVMGKFRYIIIDCPPKLDVLKRTVYNFADEVIVPVKVDFMSFQGAQQHTNDLSALRTDGAAKAKLRWVVPTMLRSRQVLARETLAAMISLYGRAYVADPIPESVDAKESPVLGQSLFEYAPDSLPAMAYAKLVRSVVNG